MEKHITYHKMRKYGALPFLLANFSAIEKRFIWIMVPRLQKCRAEMLLSAITIRPSMGGFWYRLQIG